MNKQKNLYMEKDDVLTETNTGMMARCYGDVTPATANGYNLEETPF